MASNTIATTNVQLSADIAQLKAGLNKANETIAQFGKKAGKNLDQVRKSTERQSKSILQMRRNIDTAFRGLAGSFVIREFVGLSKAVAKASVDMQLLNQRIKVFTGDSAGFAQAYEAAQLLGVAVENVAMGMGRIVAVGAEMGVTTKEARAMTTTFQQLALLSGSSIKESQAAFIQFTQALSANRLSGEELRSVREQAPLVAQAIAKYMGIAVGDIKKVAEEGKITAEVMRGAMAAAAEDAAEKFAQLPKSLERQQAEFENAWGRVMLALDTIFRQSDIWKFFYGLGRDLSEGFAAENIPAFAMTDAEIDKQVDALTRKIQDGMKKPIRFPTEAEMEAGITAETINKADLDAKRARRWELIQERQRRQMQLNIDAEKAASDVREQSYEEWFKSLDQLEVKITSQRIEPTAMEKLLQDMNSLTMTELDKLKRKWAEFVVVLEDQLASGELGVGQEAIDEFNRRWQEGIERVGGLEEVKVTAEKIFPKPEQEKLNQFVVQAASNMQSAFADFLFDPFEDGLKGMLKGFIDTIRRMVAEIAAQQLLTSFFNAVGGAFGGSIGGFFTSMASSIGKRASGGPVSSSKAYLVGEKGPELLVGASGRIIPNGGMGGVMVAPTYNIDARGATQDLAKQLPAILAAHARQTVEMARRAINDDVSRNAFGRA